MPTKKQRRRRQKDRRHDYEYVYVDDEGNEVAVDEDELKAQRVASRNGRAKPRPQAGARIQPPSWRRTFKRAAIVAPIMFLTVVLLDRGDETTYVQEALTTLSLMLIFVPFSYFMDSVMYRRFARRAGFDPDAKD